MRLNTGWTGDVIIFHKTFLFARIYQYSCDIFPCRVIALISGALLSCAVKRRMITACPVAFGETDVKGRVMSVLNYKKPSFWILCTTVIAGVAVAAGFLTDPMPAQASGTARMAPELYTDYIGDAPAVAAIAQGLPYPKDYSYASIELQTEKEPYELKIYLNGDGKLEENSFDDCFELAKERIGNLGILTFISNDTQEILAMYSKAEKESGISVEYETNSYDTGESISIIGGADGPTSIFLAGKLGGGSEEETGLKELLQTLMK